MAQRMKFRGVAGCVVGGRVRDMAELKDSHLPVSKLPLTVVVPVVPSILAQRLPNLLDLRHWKVYCWDQC